MPGDAYDGSWRTAADASRDGRLSINVLRHGEVVVLAPGESMPNARGEWEDRMIVVEDGEIELECRGGGRARFVPGDVLFVSGLSVSAIRNAGPVSAVLGTVSRHIVPTRRVDDSGRSNRSNPRP